MTDEKKAELCAGCIITAIGVIVIPGLLFVGGVWLCVCSYALDLAFKAGEYLFK